MGVSARVFVFVTTTILAGCLTAGSARADRWFTEASLSGCGYPTVIGDNHDLEKDTVGFICKASATTGAPNTIQSWHPMYPDLIGSPMNDPEKDTYGLVAASP